MKNASFAAALLVALAPATANAEGSIPAGWSAPTNVTTTTKTPAVRTRAEALDVASLPRFEMQPTPTFTAMPADREGITASEVLTRGARVTVKNHRMGGVSVSSNQEPFSAFAEGGVSPYGTHGVTSFGWTSFDEAADGEIAIEAVRGLYDFDRRRAIELDRRTMRAAKIRGTVYYGFVVSCPTCAEGQRERLHLVGPGSASVEADARSETTWGAPIVYTSLPLEPKTAGSALTFVSDAEVAALNKRLGRKASEGGALPASFHASRGSSDERATVIMRLHTR